MALPLGGRDGWFDSSQADWLIFTLRADSAGGERHGALAERQLHLAVDQAPRGRLQRFESSMLHLEEWPSGLRQRIANPPWAAPSTASSNLASSVA